MKLSIQIIDKRIRFKGLANAIITVSHTVRLLILMTALLIHITHFALCFS